MKFDFLFNLYIYIYIVKMQLEAEMKFAEWNEAVFYSFGARLQFQAVDFNDFLICFFFLFCWY